MISIIYECLSHYYSITPYLAYPTIFSIHYNFTCIYFKIFKMLVAMLPYIPLNNISYEIVPKTKEIQSVYASIQNNITNIGKLF